MVPEQRPDDDDERMSRPTANQRFETRRRESRSENGNVSRGRFSGRVALVRFSIAA